MRSPLVVGSLLITMVFGTGALASGDRKPSRQWAAVYLSEPTLIGSTIVQGPVLFVHDDARMARGEPCTSVQLFNPGEGRKRLRRFIAFLDRPGWQTRSG
jgi:hypothetical protein